MNNSIVAKAKSPIRLQVVDGHLHILYDPEYHGAPGASVGLPDERQQKNGFMLIYHYPLGDVDCITWPWVDAADQLEQGGKLAVSLFDAREMGVLPNEESVLLPDGIRFVFDEHLEDFQPVSAEGWLY